VGPGREHPIISSPSNPQVKRVLRLRDSSARRKSGRFLIDGLVEIKLAIASGIVVETIFYAGGSCPPDTMRGILPASVVAQPVTAEVLDRLSYGQRSGSPVALAVTPELPLSRLESGDFGLWLVLDRTEKPGNLGACLRTAAATGVRAVVLTDPICELFNPNTIRASRGAVFGLPLAICSVAQWTRFSQEHRIHLFCSRVHSEKCLWECDLTGRAAVVFGNEAEGLGESWKTVMATSFFIPMQGVVDSLNLSISAAVTLYEAVRQRKNI
jgi:TrmH family RNA methyltransferase